LFWSAGIGEVVAQSADPKGGTDSDFWKIGAVLVSLLSAAISGWSLRVALKTRDETARELFEEKKDAFEERKDAIARQMTDNEELAAGGKFKAERLAEGLRALPPGTIPEDKRASLCADMETVAQFNSEYLNGRPVTIDQIRSWKYHKDKVEPLRTVALSEYNMGKRLTNEGWNVMIAAAEAVLESATKKSNA
jgi:hypothetical protein